MRGPLAPSPSRFALACATFLAGIGRGEAFGSTVAETSERSVGSAAASEPYATPDPGVSPTPSPSEPVPELPLEPEPSPSEPGSLAVGITEPNPNLLWPAGMGSVPPAFALWRDAVGALRPHYYRLQIDWAKLQPDAGVRPDLDRYHPGCLRDRFPCAEWRGLREQLRALAARQAQGGWEGVVSISGTPAWAARPAGGCERDGATAYNRAPRTDALDDYGRLVEEIIAAAQDAGAQLRWWNAWNEPNHPYFISQQRLVCDPASPSESVVVYLELHAAARGGARTRPGRAAAHAR